MRKIIEIYKKTNIVFKILILLIFSVLITFFITNFEVLQLEKGERTEKIVQPNDTNMSFENMTLDNNNKLIMNKEKANILIETNGQYIEKLRFFYNAKENIAVHMKMVICDEYGSPVEITIKEDLVAMLNVSAISLRQKVNSINIEFTGTKGDIISDITIDNQIAFNPYVFICTILIGVVILISTHTQFIKKTENVFLLVATTTGLAFLFLLPVKIGLSWDDETHFLRAYETSSWKRESITLSAKLITQDFFGPFSHIDTIEERKATTNILNNVKSEQTPRTNYRNTLSQQPWLKIVYLPFALMIKLGTILNLPFSALFYTTKLFYLSIYIGIVYLAIKRAHIYKRIIAFVGLVPTTIFLSAQFSLDPLITALSLFAFASCVNEFIQKDKKLTVINALAFIAPILISSLAKQVYIPFLLIYLFLPKEKFINKKQEVYFKIGILSIFLIILSTFIIPSIFNPSSIEDPRGGNVDMYKQLSLIISQPISFIKVFAKNIAENLLPNLLDSRSAINYAYLGRNNSSNLNLLFITTAIFFGITDTYKQKEKGTLSTKVKIIFVLISIVIILMIWGSMYLLFTPISSTYIAGVQPRYFIPLLPVLLVLINSNRITNNIEQVEYNRILLYSTTIVIFVSIIQLIVNIYCI